MRPEEREAVTTTIVGGRPPGCGREVGSIPRGIEVLVKKASVDPDFKTRLIAQRGAAAQEIGLELSPAEAAMLGAIPREQLEQIIKGTEVPLESRRAFLGTAAAAMIAALGLSLEGCSGFTRQQSAGIQPLVSPRQYPPPSLEGIRPGRPRLPEFQAIYFDYDKAEIRADQLTAMESNLDLIVYLTGRGRKILITGHTDERGTLEYNLALGERRAQTVRDYMIKNSIPLASVRTMSKGQEAPADPGHTEEGWAKNRRVEFQVVDE